MAAAREPSMGPGITIAIEGRVGQTRARHKWAALARSMAACKGGAHEFTSSSSLSSSTGRVMPRIWETFFCRLEHQLGRVQLLL